MNAEVVEFDDKVTIEDNGIKKECDIVLTFDDDDTGKTYVVCADKPLDQNPNMYTLSYFLNVENGIEIVTDLKELEMVDYVIQELRK